MLAGGGTTTAEAMRTGAAKTASFNSKLTVRIQLCNHFGSSRNRAVNSVAGQQMFTASQYNQFKNHANILWLTGKHSRSEVVDQGTIRSKIADAIKSAFPDRATEANIQWVATQIGIHYGQVHTPPVIVVGRVHQDAVAEIEGTDAGLAKTVAMVFQRTATGRTSPGGTGVNHIHVEGMANRNVLFEPATGTVLGVVNQHMEGAASAAQHTVIARRGGTTVQMRVSGNSITRA